VIDLLPCLPDESHPDQTPEGIEFSAGSVLIHAPPGPASLGDKYFSASYENFGGKNHRPPDGDGAGLDVDAGRAMPNHRSGWLSLSQMPCEGIDRAGELNPDCARPANPYLPQRRVRCAANQRRLRCDPDQRHLGAVRESPNPNTRTVDVSGVQMSIKDPPRRSAIRGH
jgi:hypothetical protein